MGDLCSTHRGNLRILPEIQKFGVKRAKFFAYEDAARRGGFVYLDSDIIVLMPLIDLEDVDKFTACRDDLSECPFIEDRTRPWKRHPKWTSDRYFNSGVFASPSDLSEFFRQIREESTNDLDWSESIVPGKLYDNHYFCAKIVQHNMDVSFISEYIYNWQGFRRFNQLNCYIDDAGALCTKHDGSPLRLVHFAGLEDIEGYLAGLPIEIAQHLALAIGGGRQGVLETFNALARRPPRIDDRLLMHISNRTSREPAETNWAPGREHALVENSTALVSIALSTGTDEFSWNGLKCGGAYLAAAEYAAMRYFVRCHGIGSVLEFGAGYTTVLFKQLMEKQIALEGWNGPWLDFARQNGCDARVTPFSLANGFDEESVAAAAAQVLSGPGKSMVFVDSPTGTQARSVIIRQIAKYARTADFYVIHDAVRDAQNVYDLSMELNLGVTSWVGSLRGLVFLSKVLPVAGKLAIVPMDADARTVQRMDFRATLLQTKLADPKNRKLYIQIENVGDVVMPCGEGHGLLFSLHTVDAGGSVSAWDTPRYSLPTDLDPGDFVAFWIKAPDDSESAAALLCDFVKEGEFWWSLLGQRPCPQIVLPQS